MIEIDGSYLEGGGQIIRTAIALSAITGKGVRIFNIRKGREKPGLRPQHLEGIKAAAKICNAGTEGLVIDSLEILFTPRKIAGGALVIDTKTAGSVTLILQILVPIALHANSPLCLTIKGGTAVPFSPTIAYFRNIFCYDLRLGDTQLSLNVKRHGFYPAGGGVISVDIKPGTIDNVEMMDRGNLNRVEVLSVASTHLQSAKVAERMIDGFVKVLPVARCTSEYVQSDSPGCFIHATAHFENSRLGADALGRVGKRAEDVGTEAALGLKSALRTDCPIDSWMVDQIIPYMALATARTGMPSNARIPSLTKHAETNIWVVKKFLPVNFEIMHNVMTCTKMKKQEN